MPLKRESLERQLVVAQEVLEEIKKGLIEKGIAETELKKQPAYRDAHGDMRTVKRRLVVVTENEERTAALAAEAKE
ncbi:hypothetical protein OAK91_05065 [Planctomycetaceae bacterium]|jgi:hypothetical protein|nr:hypothetical protein [Planctomycetaceae bacterium]